MSRVTWTAAVLVLLVVNASIVRREVHRATGAPVWIELAPVDPRSLMQGDYMTLGYAEARNIPREAGRRGVAIMRLDDRRIARFERLDDGTPLQEGQIRLAYHTRAWRRVFAADAFFFQEGERPRYQPARYGDLRVQADGSALLVGLADEKLNLLGQAR